MLFFGSLSSISAFTLIQKIKLENADAQIFAIKRDMYNARAINAFRLGVVEPYCSYLDKFTLKTLVECLNRCITFDNVAFYLCYICTCDDITVYTLSVAVNKKGT